MCSSSTQTSDGKVKRNIDVLLLSKRGGREGKREGGEEGEIKVYYGG